MHYTSLRRSFLFFFFVLCQTVLFAQPTFRLMIDPGHGGKDPGRLGSKGMLNEKDINLKIALKLGEYLTANVPNVEVLYTRKTDVFLSLDEIVEKANNAQADFFISLHCNANDNKTVQGTRTHIQNHSFTSSKALALQIEKEFATRAKRYSKGIMAAEDRGTNFQVLQYTQMPGVLIEMGFLSHPQEEKFLNSDYGQSIIASAIYRAFRDFVATNPKKEDRSTFYKIQIMSSSKSENIHLPRYDVLDMRVEEYRDPNNSAYPYRYLVGREYERRLANKLAQKVEKMGFEGAFVVTMTDQSPLQLLRHNREGRRSSSGH